MSRATVSGHLEYRPLVSPASAAPLALEASPLCEHVIDAPMTVIDRWAIYQAVTESAVLRANAVNVPVWVRIHTSTAEREPQIAVLLSEVGASQRPVVEISPASQITNPRRIESFIAACHDIGVDVALDDFGLGHPTTAALLHLRPDVLKIDRCFTRGLLRSPQTRGTINMLIELAHHARIRVLAEGVEGIDVWEWLRLNGCDAIESPLISSPMRAGDVTNWLPAWERRVEAAQKRSEPVTQMLMKVQAERLAEEETRVLSSISGSLTPAEQAQYYSELSPQT